MQKKNVYGSKSPILLHKHKSNAMSFITYVIKSFEVKEMLFKNCYLGMCFSLGFIVRFSNKKSS